VSTEGAYTSAEGRNFWGSGGMPLRKFSERPFCAFPGQDFIAYDTNDHSFPTA